MTDAERESGNRKIRIGFLALVTASPPLIMLQGEPTTTQLAAAAAGGFLLGIVLLWYLRGLAAEFSTGPRR